MIDLRYRLGSCRLGAMVSCGIQMAVGTRTHLVRYIPFREAAPTVHLRLRLPRFRHSLRHDSIIRPPTSHIRPPILRIQHPPSIYHSEDTAAACDTRPPSPYDRHSIRFLFRPTTFRLDFPTAGLARRSAFITRRLTFAFSNLHSTAPHLAIHLRIRALLRPTIDIQTSSIANF